MSADDRNGDRHDKQPEYAATLVIPAQAGIEILSDKLSTGLHQADGMGDFPNGSESVIEEKSLPIRQVFIMRR